MGAERNLIKTPYYSPGQGFGTELMYHALQSQYVFIHDAIDELITCGESEIAAANIRITINRLTAFRFGGMTGFQQQFQVLNFFYSSPLCVCVCVCVCITMS